MNKMVNYSIFQLTLLLLICTRCSRGTQQIDSDFDQLEDLIEISDSISSLEQRGTPSSAYKGQNVSHSSGDSKAQKCSKQSILLARQALMHEFELINNYNKLWFNDLDQDELVEEQKHSLSNIIMSSASQQLLNDNGLPLFEIESSYFRPLSLNQLPIAMLNNNSSQQYSTTAINNLPQQQQQQPIREQQKQQQQQQYSAHTTSSNLAVGIKLMRRKDRCYLSGDKSYYIYNVGVSVGPIEHNLDVVYNLPKELRLSQPIDWRYAHIKLIVPKMNYEVTLRQVASYKLINKVNEHQKACPQELIDVTYLNSRINEVEANSSNTLSNYKFAIIANGLPKNNQTLMHLERIFVDYTRPTISKRLRQVLKFYLNSKTLPLSTS